ncbi:MAG: APC family permease [Firmicutes bacterium]|nr:APC family permease [Bacillota bacterium]
MTEERTAGQLRSDALGLGQVLFQSASNMAPGLSAVAGLTGVAAFAGPAMPLSLLLGLILAALLVVPVVQYAQRLHSAGGYYTFVAHGAGPKVGLYTAWVYLMYETASLSGTVLFFGYLLPGLLHIDFGMPVLGWMWWPATLISAGFVAIMSYRGIRISLGYAYIMGAIELFVFIAVGVVLWGKFGNRGGLHLFSVAAAPHGLSSVMLGVVFAFLSFTGFGAAVTLGEETRHPRRNIILAIIVSVVGIGLFYVFIGYASVVAWGPSHMSTYASATIPFVTLTLRNLNRIWVWALTILTLNGSLACALAIHNAQVRMLYALGRDRVIVGARFGLTHQRFQTPYQAIILQTAITVAVVTIAGVLFGPLEGFFLLGTIATLGALLVHLAVNASVGMFFRKLRKVRWLWHYVVPGLGVVFIFFPLYYTLFPAPAYPVDLAPYVVALWLAVGLIVLRRIMRRNPERLQAVVRDAS